MSTNYPVLTDAQLEAFGKEIEAIRDRAMSEVGERDANYIRKVIRAHRGLELTGRGLLFAGFFPPAFVAGVAALSASKILDNMEIGHNILHGQYDWMQDPKLSSRQFDWDTACPGDQWKHSHNYMHHTFTNIREVDRDIGYGILRMSEDEPWKPADVFNPVKAFWLAVLFQYGVALHDLETERVLEKDFDKNKFRRLLRGISRKTGRQTLKDYVIFPLLAGPVAPFVFTGNVLANLARNLWTYTIIFCGHFPDGVHQFPKSVLEDEQPGHWFYRQLLGSANLTGGKLFHVMSGNLSHQIEHHLFPTVPAHRYAEMSLEVQEVCERYGLPYNKGPIWSQFGTVVRKIFRLSLPNGPQPALPAAA